jgi:hypothetical protein
LKLTDGKRPLGRTRRKRKDNTVMDVQNVGWGMDWNGLECTGMIWFWTETGGEFL